MDTLYCRPIQNQDELDVVYTLLHDVYVEIGYCDPQPSGRLRHYARLDNIPETTVLVVLKDNEIIGTNTYTLDGPNGLHVDSEFKTECDIIRKENRKLAASWRIVTKPECRSVLSVVKLLIRETVKGFIKAGVKTAVFTFNPKHERFYQRLLNMTTVARLDESIGNLKNAPAVFMRWDIEDCPNMWLDTEGLTAKRAARKLKENNRRDVI